MHSTALTLRKIPWSQKHIKKGVTNQCAHALSKEKHMQALSNSLPIFSNHHLT